MTTEQLKNQVKEWIAKDDADKALAQLLEFCRTHTGFEKVERTALINNGQLERLDKDRHENRLSSEQYAVEKNKILSSLLSLIDDLEPVPVDNSSKSTSSPATPSNSLPTNSIHDNIFISVILLLLVSSVVAFFYFTFQEQYGQGGVFFSSASGTCLVYLNWRKKATVLTTQS